MTRKNHKQSNFRLSKKALSLLEDAAERTGLSKTHVVEVCLMEYAKTIPGMAKEACEFVRDFLAKEFGEDDRKK